MNTRPALAPFPDARKIVYQRNRDAGNPTVIHVIQDQMDQVRVDRTRIAPSGACFACDKKAGSELVLCAAAAAKRLN